MNSDSDDENFVSFGTPLEIIEEDEPLPKPISVQDQVVRDRQGRQRFHGAFTGGFSAGFFNTVGSKEGFTPSTFVSSRGKRADHHGQKPEDYMDEDDKGEYGIAPRKMVTSQRFAGEEAGTTKRLAQDSSIIPDDGRIQDVITPTDETIGARLLRRMGWKPGQGVGPKMERKKKGKRTKKKGRGDGKVYGCAKPPTHETQDNANDGEDEDDDGISADASDTDEDNFLAGFLFAPDDIQDFMFALKDDQHGIGYRGMDSRSLLGGHVTLFEEPVIKQNRRQGIKGHAFGIGAFEDEEENDVYSTDRMSNYDRVLGGEEDTHKLYGWTGPPPRHSSDGDCLDGFKASSQRKVISKVFQPPNLPRDFKPFHRFQTSSTETPAETKQEPKAHSRFSLSADQRAAMLGEEKLPGPSSVDELLSSKDLAFIKEARDKAPSSKTTMPPHQQHQSRWDRGASRWSAPNQEAAIGQGGGSSFQPFSKDVAKQRRYEEYLQSRQRGSVMTVEDARTEWEKQQEMEEFSRAASLYQKPLSGMMASRFVRAQHDDTDDTVDVPAETGGDEADQRKAAELKMFGQLTRDTLEWHPDKLLCKRFNVADPYPGSSIVGLPTVKKDKYSVFNFLEMKQPTNSQMEASTKEPYRGIMDEAEDPGTSLISNSSKRSRWDQHPGVLSHVGSGHEVKGDDSQAEIKVEESEGRLHESGADESRPPLDLFQAIFLDSDVSSNSSDEDDNQDDTRKVTEMNAIQGMESSRLSEIPVDNNEHEPPEKNEHKHLDVVKEESMAKNQIVTQLGSFAKETNNDIHRIEIAKQNDALVECEHVVEGEEEEDSEDDEEYGPALPPSLLNEPRVNEQISGRWLDSTTDNPSKGDGERKEKKEKKAKKSKKRKSDHKSRSKDRREDGVTHATGLSRSRHREYEKIKKSKSRHGIRHKHSHHKSSHGRKHRHYSSTDSESSLNSDNDMRKDNREKKKHNMHQ